LLSLVVAVQITIIIRRVPVLGVYAQQLQQQVVVVL